MDGRADEIQMIQFRVVRKRSWTSAILWWGISRRFRKISSCWFAEVRQSMKSTNTLSVRSSPSMFAKFRGQLQGRFLSDPKGR